MEHRHTGPGVDKSVDQHTRSHSPHGDHAAHGAAPATAGTAGDSHMVHSQGQHAGHSVAMFRDRFWLSLALAVPVIFFSPMFADLLGYEPPRLSRLGLDSPGVRHGDLHLRRPALPQGRPQ